MNKHSIDNFVNEVTGSTSDGGYQKNVIFIVRNFFLKMSKLPFN